MTVENLKSGLELRKQIEDLEKDYKTIRLFENGAGSVSITYYPSQYERHDSREEESISMNKYPDVIAYMKQLIYERRNRLEHEFADL